MANPEDKVDGKKQDGMAGDGSSRLCGYMQPDGRPCTKQPRERTKTGHWHCKRHRKMVDGLPVRAPVASALVVGGEQQRRQCASDGCEGRGEKRGTDDRWYCKRCHKERAGQLVRRTPAPEFARETAWARESGSQRRRQCARCSRRIRYAGDEVLGQVLCEVCVKQHRRENPSCAALCSLDDFRDDMVLPADCGPMGRQAPCLCEFCESVLRDQDQAAAEELAFPSKRAHVDREQMERGQTAGATMVCVGSEGNGKIGWRCRLGAFRYATASRETAAERIRANKEEAERIYALYRAQSSAAGSSGDSRTGATGARTYAGTPNRNGTGQTESENDDFFVSGEEQSGDDGFAKD